jgi:hypothetical protein
VQNPHGSFHFVHVLPAFAAAAESVDLQISGIDFNWRGIGDLRDNIDAGEGSVTTFVCIEGRNPHEPVHAPLGLKMSVSALAAHQQRHRFNTDFFALLDVDGLRFKSVPFDPTLIHSQQHIGPIAGFGAARAGVNREKGIGPIIFAGKKLAQLEFLKPVN